MKSRRTNAFTVIEALAAAVLVGIGISAGMGALSSMGSTEIRLRETEKLNRLAQEKLEEIIAYGNVNNAGTDGTFEDFGEPNYEWALEVTPSGVENLDTLRVVATKSQAGTNAPEGKAVGLLFTPPDTGATQ